MARPRILTPPRPHVLFLTPIAPAPTGNGLAMRAALIAEGLARAGRLWSAVVPVSDPDVDPVRMRWIAGRSETAVLVPLPDPMSAGRGWLAYPSGRRIVAAAQPLPARARPASPACGEMAAQILGRSDFDLIYVLRLYLAGAAVPFLERTPGVRAILDVDEDDETVLRTIANLHRRRGDPQAARTGAEAAAYGRLAASCLPCFDPIVTASSLESRALGRRHGVKNIVTAPNAVRCLSEVTTTPSAPDRPAKLIYIGNLDYPPNRDAVERLVTRILPAIRRALPDAQLEIVGGGVAGLAACPGVTVHGYVDDLQSVYRRADMTVIPLRAGGGSRLKILEAFANGTPVVATPEAIAGIEVNDGEQLVVASTDQALADAALRVSLDPVLAQHLVVRAASFVAAHHDFDKIADRLAALVRDTAALRRGNTL